ncbi:hypothetical protein C4577_04195 [Candidatus Parcubacteria bacterium]|nr:MAG: hypothetical protein C4577_04195 [Candidatus Parcubacteria bacterium]
MKEIWLKEENCLSDEETEKFKGTFLPEGSWNILCDSEDTKVYKPDGTVLLIYLKKVLPADICKKAWPSLREAWSQSQNRGMAAGILPPDVKLAHGNRVKHAVPEFITGTRARPLLKDGVTVSNTNYAQQVDSGIIGFMDRNARFPYCRQTAFTMKHVEKWKAALPFIKKIDKVFAKYAPERYAAQREIVNKTSPDFVIANTVFTTVTVNRNWQTAVHKDAGDYKPGFGVLSALCAGKFTGGYYTYPKYKVAVDLRTRDVILADVHEWHGNSPIIGIGGEYERISNVFYYRDGMYHCGRAEEELERVKKRKIRGGDPIYDDDEDDGTMTPV